MRTSETAELVSGQPGWSAVDRATLRAKGRLVDVIQQIQIVLDSDPVVELCKQLGISSAGFLFFDFFRSEIRFLFPSGDDERIESYYTPYLWGRTDIPTKEWSSLVHWLFYAVRSKQTGRPGREEVRTEEYFVNLPVTGDCDLGLSSADTALRKKYGIHYCSAGEMAYSIFLWRALSVARDNGWGDRPVSAAIVPFEQEAVNHVSLLWRGQNLCAEDCDESRLLSSMWGQTIGPVGTWGDEWNSLMAHSSSAETSHDSQLSSACVFAQEAGILGQNIGQVVRDHATLNSMLQNSAPEFLMRLGATERPGSVAECLDALEVNARFPILPFYVWNTLDRATKCYSVVPTWTSQNYSLQTPLGDCPHLGLALIATRPLSQIDRTINAEPVGTANQVAAASDADPRLLINFLRLTARPLVEGHIYHPLIHKVKDHIARVGEAVKNGSDDFINEILE